MARIRCGKTQVFRLLQASGDCHSEGPRGCKEDNVGPYTSWLCVYDEEISGLEEETLPAWCLSAPAILPRVSL